MDKQKKVTDDTLEKNKGFMWTFLSILCSRGTDTWKNAVENTHPPKEYEEKSKHTHHQ